MKKYAYVVCVAFLTVSALRTQGQTATWIGGGADNNFSTAANWQSGAPSASTATAYTFSATTGGTPNIQSGSYIFSSINFDAAAGAFTIGPDGTSALADHRFVAQSSSFTITQNSANNQVINATILASGGGGNIITLAGSGAGTLTLNSLRFEAGTAYNIDAHHSVILGTSSWVGNNTGTITITDSSSVAAGKVSFTQTSFVGLTKLYMGQGASETSATIEALNAGGFSSSTSLFSSQNLTFTGNGPIVLTGAFTQLGSANKTNTFSANTTLGGSGNAVQLGAANGTGSRAVTFHSSAGVTSTLAGLVTGSASTGVTSIVKAGTGTLVMSGGANYTGTTTVSGGTLLVIGDNSAATGLINIASGATFGGIGTVGGTISNSGTLDIGAGSQTGTLIALSNVGLASGSATVFDINGASAGSFDSLQVNLALTIGGALTLRLGSDLSSSTIALFTAGSTSGDWSSVSLTGIHSGNFTSLGNGLWSIDVNGNTWTLNNLTGSLTIVPEPSCWILISLSFCLLPIFGRVRRIQRLFSDKLTYSGS